MPRMKKYSNPQVSKFSVLLLAILFIQTSGLGQGLPPITPTVTLPVDKKKESVGYEERGVIIINFSPLTILDQKGIQLGAEFPLLNKTPNLSWLNEFTYFFPHYNQIPYFGKEGPFVGYVYKSELRLFKRHEVNMYGRYFAIQGFYKQLDYINMPGVKKVYCINLKFGHQWINDSGIVFDLYGGFGYRNAVSTDTNPSDLLGPKPNITVGFRVGYMLSKANPNPEWYVK